MNARFAQAIKEGLLATGHYARRLARVGLPGVAVLCYHGVRADDDDRDVPFADLHVRARELEAQLRVLRDLADPISLAEWRAAQEGRGRLPRRPVLVTFDDGYRSVLARALPLLRRYGVPAVVFVSSGAVKEGRLFWYDALARARGEAAVEPAKSLAWAAWRSLVDEVATGASGEGDPLAVLSSEDVGALAAAAEIEIGGHSADHPILARAPAGEQRRQVGEDRDRLAAWCGRPVRAFAYPNGRPGIDYTPETVGIVGEAGFADAFTTRVGFATDGEPRLERSRFLVLAGTSGAELAHRLCYSWRRV